VVKPDGVFSGSVFDTTHRRVEPPHTYVRDYSFYCSQANEWSTEGRARLSGALPMEALDAGDWCLHLMFEAPDDDDGGKLIASLGFAFGTSPALRLSAS
jgi:hypothetical protein